MKNFKIETPPQYNRPYRVVATAAAMSGNLKRIVEAGDQKINIYANTYFVLRNLTSV